MRLAHAPAPRISRRAVLGAVAAVGAALAGCGFQLRRTAGLSFQRLALTGFDARSPLAAEFRRVLGDADVELVDVPAQAQVVLQALEDVTERHVVASTSAGQVREIQLRVRLAARADAPGGRPLLAPFTLRLTRDLSYSETAALAKAQEEAGLLREMHADVVAQVLRRLAAVQA